MYGRLAIVLVLWGAAFASNVSQAAPFCLARDGVADVCYYYTVEECTKVVKEVGGECFLGGDTVIMPVGRKSYCTVFQDQYAECLYESISICEHNAKNSDSVCIRRRSSIYNESE